MGDMMGLGVSMAAMGTMMPQMTEIMKGFNNPLNSLQTSSTDTQANHTTLKCSKCGNSLPANAKFCLECGTKVELLNDNETVCKACGKKTPKGKFCMECGAPLVLKCANCGANVPEGGKFCLECGTKIV